jgi:hypothetical protein
VEDKYFEDLFNEEKEPFSNFLNRLDLYPFSPVQKLDFQLDLNSPISKLDLESFKLQSIPTIQEENITYTPHEDNITKGMMEEIKEDESSESRGSGSLKDGSATAANVKTKHSDKFEQEKDVGRKQ